jgi:hypothetical protein
VERTRSPSGAVGIELPGIVPVVVRPCDHVLSVDRQEARRVQGEAARASEVADRTQTAGAIVEVDPP